MANLAARNGCDTMIWIRDAETAEEINKTHINKRYLPDFTLESSYVQFLILSKRYVIEILF